MKRIITAIAVFAVIISCAAEQFVLLKGERTWSGKSQWYGNKDNLNNPPSWKSPDYLHGDMYLKLDILKKPTDIQSKIQICLWHTKRDFKNPDEFCVSGSKNNMTPFTKQGDVVWWKWPDIGGDPAYVQGTRWTGQVIDYVLFQLRFKHPDTGKWPEAKTCGTRIGSKCFGPGADDHYPITWDAKMVIVSKGSQLDPADSEVQWTGCPWGCDGATTAFRAVETDAGTFYYQMLYTRNIAGGIELDVRSNEQHALSVYSAQGCSAARVSGTGAQTHTIGNLSHGVYMVRGTIDGQRIASTLCVK